VNARPALLAIALTACAAAGAAPARPKKPVAPVAAAVVPPEAPAVPPQLRGLQYLFGSGEAAALTRQVWHVLADFVDGAMADGKRQGVVLSLDATLANPRFVDCGDKPPAIVFDVDETVLLNDGAEYDDLVSGRKVFSGEVWDRWEKTGANHVEATPGAKEALDRLRDHGVTVIFNTNRVDAAGAEAALNVAGLGPARHGETLFLAGDDTTGSHKDARRQVIAAKYCVLAMGGDQLGDFSDLFNSAPNGVAGRRATVAYSGIADLWGNGWFVLPNPVYGSALKGSADDIFPKDKQWRDPGPPAAPPPPAPEKVNH
jgi:5'-nucleotidase (lipoprotein e(P4) family)